MKILYQEEEKDKLKELAIWVEISLLETLRNDDDVDNLEWVRYWIDFIKAIEREIYPCKTESSNEFTIKKEMI